MENQFDYRLTESGKRRFGNPELYLKTVEFQNFLDENGVAWHNPFSNECTMGFECCMGTGNHKHYFPSYQTLVKDFCKELFEDIKHGDQEHQDWLENRIETFLKVYFENE